MTTSLARAPHAHRPGLSEDVYPDDELVLELTDSLRSRLVPVTPTVELEQRVRATLDTLAPVHVTSYLGVLVERRLRVDGQATPHRLMADAR
jgi:hypothetical protein